MFRLFLLIHALFGGVMATLAVISAYALGFTDLGQLAAAGSLAVIAVTPLSCVVWREIAEFDQHVREMLAPDPARLPVLDERD